MNLNYRFLVLLFSCLLIFALNACGKTSETVELFAKHSCYCQNPAVEKDNGWQIFNDAVHGAACSDSGCKTWCAKKSNYTTGSCQPTHSCFCYNPTATEGGEGKRHYEIPGSICSNAGCMTWCGTHGKEGRIHGRC